jgi:aspartate/methionine/tyrosine aminotransferase
MFDLAVNYQNVISLGIGEPGFNTPENIVEAGIHALYQGYTKYTPNAGLLELREAVAEKLTADGLPADPRKNIIITTGAGEAIMLALLAVVNPGEEVLVPDPCWPNYYGQIHLAGATVKPVRTWESDGFHLKAEAVEEAISERTKALIINTPSNPTGAVLSKEELEEIAEVALKHDLVIISDEPYASIVYDGRKHFSIGALPGMADHVITVNSFSKTYAMTGWRVGYAHGPADVIAQMVKLQESVSSCVNSAAQRACIEALRGPQDSVKKMVEEYEKRRKRLVAGLNELPGIKCTLPEGAFYAFPNITGLNRSSREVAMMFLEKAQVVVVPGTAFGEGGEGYLRVSFGGSMESIETALERLRAILTC